jgi:Cyclic nucleotide-binding domain
MVADARSGRRQGYRAPGVSRLGDCALFWCSRTKQGQQRFTEITAIHTDASAGATGIDIRDQYLCQGMTEAEINQLLSVGKMTRFAKGDLIFRAGEYADSFFFVINGKVNVTVYAGVNREIRYLG